MFEKIGISLKHFFLSLARRKLIREKIVFAMLYLKPYNNIETIISGKPRIRYYSWENNRPMNFQMLV